MTVGVAVAVLVQAVLVAVAGGQARRAAVATRARTRLRSGNRRRGWPSFDEARSTMAARAGDRDAGALADAVDALTAAMAAGVPVVVALETSARVAPRRVGGLDDAAASIRRGTSVVAALDRWASGREAPSGASLVAAAFAIAATTGSDPAHALAGVGTTLRERRALAREVRALATQARVSAAVIAIAPLAFSLVTAGLGGTSTRFFLGSPLGALCLAVGVGLDIVGWRWMRRVTESVR
jgi:tight adherence protein B